MVESGLYMVKKKEKRSSVELPRIKVPRLKISEEMKLNIQKDLRREIQKRKKKR